MELNFNPESNVDIELLRMKVKALTIKDEPGNIAASQLLGEIDNALDELTGRRDDIIRSLNDRIAEVNSEYAPYVRQLRDLKDTVKAEMLSYRERAKLELRKLRQGIADGTIERSELWLDDKGKLLNESALSIRTGQGLSSVRKYYTITITDLALIPDDYKVVDKKALREAAKKGIKNIPGVNIVEKEAVQYRGKQVA